ncbi:MAG: alpha/beta hydrolase [Trueperella sp.]|nr:alpha/beta hydrolase [Trueperella sp.]
MAKRTEFKFSSSFQNTPLRAVIFQPEPGQPIKGLVQIIHGYAEHIDRYADFMTFLAGHGYLVFGHDHLGHGKSVASPEDLTDMGGYGVLDDVLGDVVTLSRLVKTALAGADTDNDVVELLRSELADAQLPANAQDLPFTMLGHSMGSLILRGILAKYPENCDRAVVMGTGYMAPIMVQVFAALLGAIKLFHDGSYRSPLANQLAIGANNNSFKPARTENDWLSVNTENVDRYNADPLSGNSGALHTFHFLKELMAFIGRPQSLANMRKDLPVFFVSGAEDAFGNFGKGPKQVYQMFEKAGMQDLQLKIYPNMRHEILNEDDARQVYQDILEFIER